MNMLTRPLEPEGSRSPLGLMYIAAMDENTMIWDPLIQGDPIQAIKRIHPRVVGVTMLTPKRQDSIKILRAAKDDGCVTVAGGAHPSIMYEQMLAKYPFIDYIVVGDGEYSWKMICDWGEGGLYNNRVLKGYIAELDKLPIPAFNKVDMRKYQQHGVVLSRGCSGHCTYCSTWWVSGKYRFHSEDWLTEELRQLDRYNIKYLVWDDDCLTDNPEATYGMIRAMSKFHFTAEGDTRVDKMDEEMVKEFARVGFTLMAFGIESGSQTILDKIHKNTDLGQAIRVREWCKKYGIRVKALMMTGFPFETEQTKREDAEFRARLAPDEWGSVGFVKILPGTAMYREYKKEGKITDDFWLGDEPWMVA